MQNQLKISLAQSDTIWGNCAENLKKLEGILTTIKSDTDLIVLPEMFSTGFDMQPQKVAETMQGKAVTWMKKMAIESNYVLTGSLIISENNCFYNRFLVVFPSGEILHYDKKHLFTLAGEEKVYTAGNNRLIFEYKGWRIAPFVCYDLRFPAWCRNNNNYHLAIYSANWPKPRINAWDTLLQARAIENMSYVIGVNRVGVDANNLEYSGHSQAISPLGEVLKMAEENAETCISITIQKDKLLEIREKFQFLNDQDSFEFLK